MPLLLDLFCGAGGCARGYQWAGFYVVGVDNRPQPRYAGDEFVQADALEVLRVLLASGTVGGYRLEDFAAIHASPPCQAYSTMGQRFAETQANHPELIAPVREILKATGSPYVIENVMGARRELDHPIMVCGASVGTGVGRHRLFECSFPVMSLACACDGDEVPVYGRLDGRRIWTRADGSELRAPSTLGQAQTAMGIDWMPWDSLTQAIPPAYTEHIGQFLMAEVNARAAA